MTADLVLKNGWIVTPEETVKGGVAISDGKFVAIGTDDSLPDGQGGDRHKGQAHSARSHRCARAFPGSRSHPQGGFRHRIDVGGLRRNYHRHRHAQSDSARPRMPNRSASRSASPNRNRCATSPFWAWCTRPTRTTSCRWRRPAPSVTRFSSARRSATCRSPTTACASKCSPNITKSRRAALRPRRKPPDPALLDQ